MNRAIRDGLLALSLLAAAAIPAWAAPTIDAGTHFLLPGSPLQQIEIYVTEGMDVQGLSFYVQIADGGPEAAADFPAIVGQDGPAITGLDLVTGTIFEADNAGQAITDIGYPQYLEGNIATTSPATQGGDPGTSVMATGLVATVTIDTTGFTTGGSYDLVLDGALDGIVGTEFSGLMPDENPDGTKYRGRIPTDVTNGTITIGAFASTNAVTSNADGSWSTASTWLPDDTAPGTLTAVTVLDDAVDVEENRDAFSLNIDDAAGKLTVGVNDRLAIHENATVTAGTLAAQVSGDAAGLLNVGRELDLGGTDDQLGLDWVPNGAGSQFGGTYEIARYQTLNGAGFDSLGGGNIGSAYIQDVSYGDGTDDAITVTLANLIPGDTNLDGDVDVWAFDGSGDAQALTSNLGTATGMTWSDGDFSFDGDVDVWAFDGSGDAQTLTSNLGTTLDVGPDVADGMAEALYNPATGELFFDVGAGIGVVGVTTEGMDHGAVRMDSIFGTPGQNVSNVLAYFATSGLPTGEDSVGAVLPKGLTQDDIGFSYTPVGGATTVVPVTIIVPEPSTIALLAVVGLAGLVCRRRRS